MDTLDKAARFRVMSSNKSRGTRSTETRFRFLLVRAGVRGWKMGHDLGRLGHPDIVFPRKRLAVFLDGCFWHGCRHCRSIPEANRKFWLTKLRRNKNRDRVVSSRLRAAGWKVIRIWEHELRESKARVMARVLRAR